MEVDKKDFLHFIDKNFEDKIDLDVLSYEIEVRKKIFTARTQIKKGEVVSNHEMKKRFNLI